MKAVQGLVCAYLLDGQGGGKALNWNEIRQWTPEQGCLWVHLDYKSPYARRWLRHESNLHHITVNALIADESRPRTIQDSSGLAIFLRAVNLNPGSDPEDMVSIRVWINKHRIISTRKQAVLSTKDIREQLEKKEGPTNPSQFLSLLMNKMVTRMSDVVNELSDSVDDLEENILTAQTHELRPLIGEIRRQTISMRRYLAPQRDALIRLQMEKTMWIDELDLIHIRECSDRIMRYIEDLDSARDRAAVTQDELTSKLSDLLDQRMYMLSLVAVIFLPLTFITGLLGINVGGIPGSKDPWAFTAVCFALLIVGLFLAVIFKIKKWL